jgi:energy-coupling factor transport system permease protein
MYNIKGISVNNTSMFYKINPVIKMLFVLIISLTVLFVKNNYAVTSALIVSIFLILLSKDKIKNILRYIFSLRWFCIFIFVFNYIVLHEIIPSLVSVGQMLSVLLFNLFLIKTTSKKDLEYAIYKLLVGFRIIGFNTESLVVIISLIIRFIPEILNIENKIMVSQSCRGVDYYSKNIGNKLRIVYASIIPLIRLCIKKADDTADSMEVRCYNSNVFRYNKRDLTFYDIIYLLISSIVIFLIIYLEVLL